MKIVAQDHDIAMGTDVASKHLAVAVIPDGEVLKEATIRHTRLAIWSFLTRLPGYRIRAASEAGCFNVRDIHLFIFSFSEAGRRATGAVAARQASQSSL